MAKLSNEYKTMLLNLKPDDITASFIFEYLADRVEKLPDGTVKTIPPKIRTNDTFELEANEYFNKEKITTNVGLFIYNKFLFEGSLSEVVGYINTPVTSKVHDSIEGKIASALLNDKITVNDMGTYLNKVQWLGMQFNSVFSSSFTMNTIKPNPKVMKRKKELVKKYEKEIADGDISVITNIESELVSIAKEELKDDHGMNLYNSGAKGNIANNLKTNTIMKGPVINSSTQKWEVVTSGYIEGITKDEISAVANAGINAQYPKSVGTQVAGAITKELTAAFQDISIIEEDCGSTQYLTMVITPDNKKDFILRYIKNGSKLLLLTEDNINSYVGKSVQLRSIMYCKSKKICKVCAGTIYEKLGITNVGLATAKLSGTLLNTGMKKFHNATVSMNKLDLSTLSL